MSIRRKRADFTGNETILRTDFIRVVRNIYLYNSVIRHNVSMLSAFCLHRTDHFLSTKTNAIS